MEEKKKLSLVDRLSVGQQAALKRCAGKSLRDADATALQAFYASIPADVPQYDQEKYFTVICLMCMWKPEKRIGMKPFAECARILSASNSEESLRKGMINILDTAWNDDGYLISKIARLARRMLSNGSLYPDFEDLLTDLIYWNSTERIVQKKWMSQFVQTIEKNSLTEEE